MDYESQVATNENAHQTQGSEGLLRMILDPPKANKLPKIHGKHDQNYKLCNGQNHGPLTGELPSTHMKLSCRQLTKQCLTAKMKIPYLFIYICVS